MIDSKLGAASRVSSALGASDRRSWLPFTMLRILQERYGLRVTGHPFGYVVVLLILILRGRQCIARKVNNLFP
jgi:hypothetical protein